MRSAVNQASAAADAAKQTGAQLGNEAQGIGSTLTPFLTNELEHPQGYGQEDMSAMLSAAEGGAGGATAGIVGKANQEAAQTRNAGGFQAVLDDAARARTKAAAGASEGIAADNAGVKQQQQQNAEKGLQGLYGTDTSGMLDATGQISRDVDSEVNASKTGWLQNTEGIMATLNNGANSVANVRNAFK